VTRLLNDEISQEIIQVFQQLKEPVEVLFFGRKTDCDYCDDTRQLVNEVISLSDKLSLSIHDIEENTVVAKQYGVDKTPGLVIAARDGDEIRDYGIRFSGIPSGHEFSSLIHDLVLVSSRESGLDAQTKEILHGLTKPVHLQVFVTPT
jgi:alkyl hydroperoxide reductase subunit AhpF